MLKNAKGIVQLVKCVGNSKKGKVYILINIKRTEMFFFYCNFSIFFTCPEEFAYFVASEIVEPTERTVSFPT